MSKRLISRPLALAAASTIAFAHTLVLITINISLNWPDDTSEYSKIITKSNYGTRNKRQKKTQVSRLFALVAVNTNAFFISSMNSIIYVQVYTCVTKIKLSLFCWMFGRNRKWGYCIDYKQSRYSMRPGDACMHRRIMSIKVQIMACCLNGAMPPSEPVLACCQKDPLGQTLWNCHTNTIIFIEDSVL